MDSPLARQALIFRKLIDDALYQRRIADYKLQPMRGDKLAMHHPTGDGLNANVSACLLIDATIATPSA